MFILQNAKEKIIEVYVNLANIHGLNNEHEELAKPISDKRLQEIVCKIESVKNIKPFNFDELVETYNNL